MNNSPFNQIDDFDSIIRSKSFEELSSFQQNAITKVMTAAEYTALHESLLGSTRVFAEEEKLLGNVPPLSVFNKTLPGSMVVKDITIAQYLRGFLTVRVPLYQAGIAICLIALILLLVTRRNTEHTNSLVAADTVYIVSSDSPKPLVYQTGSKQESNRARQFPAQKTEKRLVKEQWRAPKKDIPVLSGKEKETFLKVAQIALRQRRGSAMLNDSNLYRVLVRNL
jgi:hypothetical protein